MSPCMWFVVELPESYTATQAQVFTSEIMADVHQTTRTCKICVRQTTFHVRCVPVETFQCHTVQWNLFLVLNSWLWWNSRIGTNFLRTSLTCLKTTNTPRSGKCVRHLAEWKCGTEGVLDGRLELHLLYWDIKGRAKVNDQTKVIVGITKTGSVQEREEHILVATLFLSYITRYL